MLALWASFPKTTLPYNSKRLICFGVFKQALSRMKAEWKDIEFVFVQYKDTGISILSAVDDLQVRSDEALLLICLKDTMIRGLFID